MSTFQQFRTRPSSRIGACPRGDWELVGHYTTMEMAAAAVAALSASGVESTIAMIDGLCVIARVVDRSTC